MGERDFNVLLCFEHAKQRVREETLAPAVQIQPSHLLLCWLQRL